MKVRAHVAIPLLLLTLVGIAPPASADWTHWRGPEQNGISREIGLVDDWSLAGNNVLWQADVGGRATPIIMRGRVYLNCRTVADEVPANAEPAEQPSGLREQVVCLDLTSGELLWQDEFNVAQTDIAVERVGWASMAGDPETGFVYMHSVSGLLRCYTHDGRRVWEHWLGEEYGKLSGFGGRTQTPIIDEDRIIISFLAANWGETAGPVPKHYYYAFDKRTGELQWVSAPGGRPHDTNCSIPIIKVIDGVRMLIGGNSDGGIYALQARTGQPIWGFRMSKRGLNASPVTDGTRVYISHGEDNIDNLNFGRVECIDATGRGDVTESHSVWRVDGIKAGFTGLLVHAGILYVVADTGMLHALDAETGAALWTHHLGTMGRGSPTWADGKLYVTEVHGNVHILQPSRDECLSLSHVTIPAKRLDTFDGIFASPAISDGKIVIVTRDRTICLANRRQTPQPHSPPQQPAERGAEAAVAHVQLVPAEVLLRPGDQAKYRLRTFDRHGRLLETLEPELSAEPPASLQVSGHQLSVPPMATSAAGSILGQANGHRASARFRVLPDLPWRWDFESYQEKSVPTTWVRAFGKLLPRERDGSTVMQSRPGKGRPSAYIWLGDPAMSGYTIQADVMLNEERRRLSNIGITAQRYNLILKGNTGRLELQSWAPQLRMAREVPFRVEPDVWYTLKLRVEVAAGQAIVHGKVWPRGTDEPREDTIQAADPHANLRGSPGLYVYSLADCYFDNVAVTATP